MGISNNVVVFYSTLCFCLFVYFSFRKEAVARSSVMLFERCANGELWHSLKTLSVIVLLLFFETIYRHLLSRLTSTIESFPCVYNVLHENSCTHFFMPLVTCNFCCKALEKNIVIRTFLFFFSAQNSSHGWWITAPLFMSAIIAKLK